MTAWERRWHPLRNEWVTITSHRNQRPWSSPEAPDAHLLERSRFDANCYLCPGNERVSGRRNDLYDDVFVFDNDHPSFSPDAPRNLEPAPGIYKNAPAVGHTRVMCYAPDHSQSLAEQDQQKFETVLEHWAEETESLLQQPDVSQVLIFENRGEVIGVSNPHPHCQIYAADFEFKHLEIERWAQQQYFANEGRALMSEIIATEQAAKSRVIYENDSAIAFLPYFSRFPFESYICPMNQYRWLFEMPAGERQQLATALRHMLVRYDNLWNMPFPYMMVLHQAPRGVEPGYHFHIQIHPLMRRPGLQKFLAGVESGGGHFLNDVDPEAAAAQLRDLSSHHYLNLP